MTASQRLEDSAGPTADAIRRYMDQLLGAAGFQASPRRQKLLHYVVEQTLLGRASRLKAFDLAVAVLGRDERFDPQSDPIVRIEMGRLRRDLDHYYEAAGAADPIRISIPKGHYVPTFSFRHATSEQVEPAVPPAPVIAATRRPVFLVAVACLTLLALLAGVLGWQLLPLQNGGRRDPQALGPAVIVLPLEALSSDEGSRALANGLTNGLIDRLMRFDGIEVFHGLQTSHGSISLPPAATGLPAYVVAGAVERAADRARVTARLTERSSGKILWSQTYDRTLTTAGIFDVESELSSAIVGRLAQGYGVIAADAARQLGQERPETFFAYECVQRAFEYRRSFDRALYPAARACLEESVRREPRYAAAWAMLAFAHMDASRFGLIEPAAGTAEIQAGLAMARRAAELAPDSVTSLQSLAALQFVSGDIDAAEATQRRAITLNPHNPESLAQLGWRLTALGRAAEGGSLLQAAVDYSVSPPRWYHTTLALAYYLNGRPDKAREVAELGRGFCCGGSVLMLALAEAALGHAAAAQAAYAEAVSQEPLLGSDQPAYFRRLGVAKGVADRLIDDLAKAGLVPPASR